MGKKEFTWSETEEGSYAYYGDEELGYIDFHKPWKKFVWNQAEDIIMSWSCIKEVMKKLVELKKDSEITALTDSEVKYE